MQGREGGLWRGGGTEGTARAPRQGTIITQALLDSLAGQGCRGRAAPPLTGYLFFIVVQKPTCATWSVSSPRKARTTTGPRRGAATITVLRAAQGRTATRLLERVCMFAVAQAMSRFRGGVLGVFLAVLSGLRRERCDLLC